jgi:hypothetical protein
MITVKARDAGGTGQTLWLDLHRTSMSRTTAAPSLRRWKNGAQAFHDAVHESSESCRSPVAGIRDQLST